MQNRRIRTSKSEELLNKIMHMHRNATYIGAAEFYWSQEEGRGLVTESLICLVVSRVSGLYL